MPLVCKKAPTLELSMRDLEQKRWLSLGGGNDSKMKITWKVDCITFKFGYILQRLCCPSLVRICWTIKSIATWLSPPRGMIMSAYFLVGRIKSSKAGLTNLAYWKFSKIFPYQPWNFMYSWTIRNLCCTEQNQIQRISNKGSVCFKSRNNIPGNIWLGIDILMFATRLT
jgi:hypothetical protein